MLSSPVVSMTMRLGTVGSEATISYNIGQISPLIYVLHLHALLHLTCLSSIRIRTLRPV
jgi:hypothetical protein